MHTAKVTRTSLLKQPTSQKQFGFSANTTGWLQLLKNKLTEKITWRHILMLPLTRVISRRTQQHHKAVLTGKPLFPETITIFTIARRRYRSKPASITHVLPLWIMWRFRSSEKNRSCSQVEPGPCLLIYEKMKSQKHGSTDKRFSDDSFKNKKQ